MMLDVVKGALVTMKCHGTHSSSHSAGVGRPCCSQRTAQYSAQCTWDVTVLLAIIAHLVSTLGAVAHTSTSLSGLAYVRARAAFVAQPFLWRWVRHGSFSTIEQNGECSMHLRRQEETVRAYGFLLLVGMKMKMKRSKSR